jgi:sporulation protein YlmC with PRC-barrel domain
MEIATARPDNDGIARAIGIAKAIVMAKAVVTAKAIVIAKAIVVIVCVQVLIALAAASAPGFAAAPGDSPATPRAATAERGRAPYAVRTRDLIGREVVNFNRQPIGTVADLIIDMRNGGVRYAAVALRGDGLEGIFAIPLGMFVVPPVGKAVELDIPREFLERLPSWTSAGWADHGLANAALRVRDPNAKLVRATALTRDTVLDRQSQDIGKLKDVVVSDGWERVEYVVLGYRQGTMARDRLFPVPLSNFTLRGNGQDGDRQSRLVLEADTSLLRELRGLPETSWPLVDPAASDASIEPYMRFFRSIDGR